MRFFDPGGVEQGEQATLWQRQSAAGAGPDAKAGHPGHRRSRPTAMATGTIPCRPAAAQMRHQPCSSWTVTLEFQTLNTLARGPARADRPHRACGGAGGAGS